MHLHHPACLMLVLLDLRPSGSEPTPATTKSSSTETPKWSVTSALADIFDPEDMINWQDESSIPILEELKSSLGEELVRQCVEHASPALQKNTTDHNNQFEYSVSFQNCILKYKWSKELNIKPNEQRRMNVVDQLNIFKNYYKFDRPMEADYYVYGDCFFKNKTYVVDVPNMYNDTECYWKEKAARQTEFWAFWGQYGPDILYTYEFVLNSNGRDVKDHVNRLWFVLAYIKIIATHFENPLELSEALKLALNNEDAIKYAEQKLEELESSVDKLEIAISGGADGEDDDDDDKITGTIKKVQEYAPQIAKYTFEKTKTMAAKVKEKKQNSKQGTEEAKMEEAKNMKEYLKRAAKQAREKVNEYIDKGILKADEVAIMTQKAIGELRNKLKFSVGDDLEDTITK